jgi:integrase/recombinase XerD
MTPLRQRMIEDMQLRNFSIHTQKAYALHVALFARHFDQSPDLLGPENIRTYQLYLRAQKQWAPASIIQATAALRFLYTVTLKNDWELERVLPIPRRHKSLPTVLSPEKVLHFLGCIGNLKHQTVLTACYAAGLRVSEAVSLKPHNIDSQRMVLHVERGKGPLRHALGEAVGELASLVADRKTTRLAISRSRHKSPHHDSGDLDDMPRGSCDSSHRPPRNGRAR